METCGLTRGELDLKGWVTAKGICIALKPDGTECNRPYSAHPSADNLLSLNNAFLELRKQETFAKTRSGNLILAFQYNFKFFILPSN
jgi:hypothetical protein